jgi:multidrug efflux pump subunit AcrA (membrane-fusion protein)
MNRHIEKIVGDARDIRRQGWSWYREQPKWKQLVEAIVVGAFIVFLVTLGSDEVVPDTAKAARTVTVAPVSELANSDTNLPLLGTVTSTSEATIRSESSGKLTRVYKKLGDYVTAGQVIAEFENSGERAAVLQAEGAYDSAKAARDIARINSGTTNSSLSESKNNALNAIANAYITMDDVIRVKTDTFYSNADNENATFLLSVPDAQLVYSIESQRKAVERMLEARATKNRTLTTGNDLIGELNLVQTEVQMIKTYLDDLASAHAKAVPDATYSQSTIDGGKTTVGIARSTISGTISSVTASRTALNASIGAQEVAGKTSGDSSGSVATADASVKQALGAYNAALSRLEKTVIRSPISGTLNSLSIETGDFISAFTEVGIVSNNGALEVLAYITEDDAKRIQVGNLVMIDNSVKGIITRVASAIDPRTKKIEVRVGITDTPSSLVNGQSVRVNITKAKQNITSTSGPIKIPLSALKLTPNGAFVFTMSATSSLIAISVKEGAILGEEIQILSGLNGTESIVTDARGLKEGMVVVIKE